MLPSLPDTTAYTRPPEELGPDLRALPALAAPKSMRVLDFDIENRPLSYWYDGQATAEITAIAWSWIPRGPEDNPQVHCEVLEPGVIKGQRSARRMLRLFVEAYNRADMVTGHYIRKHDLPIINAMLVELGEPTLRPKLTQDTRLDLVRWKDLAASQEALGAMLGLSWPKVHMTQTDWRDANRLTNEGITKTRERVIGDVLQHMEMREALLERRLLKAPKKWRS